MNGFLCSPRFHLVARLVPPLQQAAYTITPAVRSSENRLKLDHVQALHFEVPDVCGPGPPGSTHNRSTHLLPSSITSSSSTVWTTPDRRTVISKEFRVEVLRGVMNTRAITGGHPRRRLRAS